MDLPKGPVLWTVYHPKLHTYDHNLLCSTRAELMFHWLSQWTAPLLSDDHWHKAVKRGEIKAVKVRLTPVDPAERNSEQPECTCGMGTIDGIPKFLKHGECPIHGVLTPTSRG